MFAEALSRVRAGGAIVGARCRHVNGGIFEAAADAVAECEEGDRVCSIGAAERVWRRAGVELAVGDLGAGRYGVARLKRGMACLVDLLLPVDGAAAKVGCAGGRRPGDGPCVGAKAAVGVGALAADSFASLVDAVDLEPPLDRGRRRHDA